MSMLTLFMGGRVAEELVIGDITSGAASDLKEATRIARLMVCSWGMSELGPQTFGANEELLFFGREVSRSQDYSEETARRIDSEVSRLLRESHAAAKGLISSHREALDTLAKALLERETLDGEEARAMLAASLHPAQPEG
jgi:cell division protease FtsH